MKQNCFRCGKPYYDHDPFSKRCAPDSEQVYAEAPPPSTAFLSVHDKLQEVIEFRLGRTHNNVALGTDIMKKVIAQGTAMDALLKIELMTRGELEGPLWKVHNLAAEAIAKFRV